ncbi:Insulin-like growth factor-binding protein complex acid labile subunit [Chionoecetes opilio]|uniref:Insulin-like growth factor-binding protein complex acid labile subunit n=1 Tax=Chionoecetes opilio TaxID=41210 RepID=A0A8J4YD18_CHIOP|nr:Insulin-like growth factor-binding protein complex acid labile subunit [Chionoecetes opilio]
MQTLACLFTLGVVTLGAAVPLGCPRECTCQEAPLRAASFVLTWMTSWGEDDLPEIHPNEVGEAGDLVNSQTAASAGVDVDVVGLHATCALSRDTNLTSLLHALPSTTMVLTILQAAGSNVAVVEESHLKPLAELRALHLQGYARRRTTQVSGYFSNRVEEMVKHKKVAEKEEEEQELRLALSVDALSPLTKLELLDLQYVRLVAAVEGGRLRRDIEPLSTATMLDMSLPYFRSLTEHMEDLDIPSQVLSKLAVPPPSAKEHPEVGIVLLDETSDEVVPYDVFKTETEVQLAPFMAQAKLKYLRLAHAKLDRVGPELLNGLSGLHTLTLEHNHIKVLPAAMFAPTPHLHHLSLAHNNIITLDGDSLAGLEELLTLDLDGNKLDKIGPHSFPRLLNIATIRLLENPIEHVFPFTFENINSTETLLLGSRQVSAEIHVDTFRELTSLRVLQIENTTLSSLSRTLLGGMPNLRELTIHGHVTSIDFDAFTATPDLDSLKLDNCRLTRLSLDAFFGLKNLRYLDLSHNDLNELSPGTFDHLASLRELYLHHNNLTTLPPAIFLPLPAKLIQVHENPWHCTCDLRQLRPALTNKVRGKGYTTCRFLERSGMLCSQPDPPRLRYDSRVAPLCVTPDHHRLKSVFKVTARRLKCPRHVWDPRPLPLPILSRSVNVPEVQQEFKKLASPVEEENNWIPLSDFSVPPHEVKDLLEIAEAEMPEEAYAPFPEAVEEEREGKQDNAAESREESVNEEGEREELEDILIGDEDFHQFDVVARYERRHQMRYQLGKQAMKKHINEKQRRRGEAHQARKQQYWGRLAERKRNLKAQMVEEEQRDMQRKEQEMKTLVKEQQLSIMGIY